MEKLIEKLTKNEIFNGIDSNIIEDIIAEVDYYINKYDEGQIIAQEEDKCYALGFILSTSHATDSTESVSKLLLMGS